MVKEKAWFKCLEDFLSFTIIEQPQSLWFIMRIMNKIGESDVTKFEWNDFFGFFKFPQAS